MRALVMLWNERRPEMTMTMHKQQTISVTGQSKNICYFPLQGPHRGLDLGLWDLKELQIQLHDTPISSFWHNRSFGSAFFFKDFAFGANSAGVFKQSTLMQSPFLKVQHVLLMMSTINKLNLIVLLLLNKGNYMRVLVKCINLCHYTHGADFS